MGFGFLNWKISFKGDCKCLHNLTISRLFDTKVLTLSERVFYYKIKNYLKTSISAWWCEQVREKHTINFDNNNTNMIIVRQETLLKL